MSTSGGSIPADHVRIRVAGVAERQTLEALQLRASLNNPGDREALLAHPDAIELPPAQIAAGQVFVAERGGAILGFAAVLPRDDGNTELDGLFSEPGAWGQGVGRALVEHCAAYARSQGARFLHVVGNPHAEGFYKKCGFERFGTVETRFGPGLVFRRPLSQS
jgi:GNAT superfamily N-acetyltransferase